MSIITTKYESGGVSTLIYFLIFAIIGYFVYGNSINGALAMILLCFIAGLSILIALIPIAGIFIQYLVLKDYIFPWVFNLTGIYATWATSLVFWIYIILGILVWVWITWLVFERLR